MRSPTPNIPTPTPRTLSPLTFDDLVADLVWPRLLRAGPLALRPARMGLGLVYLLLSTFSIFVCGALLGETGRTKVGEAVTQIFLSIGASGLGNRDGASLGHEIHDVFVRIPAELVWQYPLHIVPLFAVLVLLTAVFGGAISRMAATEASVGASLSWPQGLAFGLTKVWSLVGALVIPLGVIWGIALGLAIVGGGLFSVPILNILGGVLFPLFLIAGVIAAIASLVLLVAHPLLIPSVTCEGTDAIDAVQHAYSFVVTRPLRLLCYLAILLVQWVLVFTVLSVIVFLSLRFVHFGMTAFGAERALHVANSMPGLNPKDGARDALVGTEKLAGGLVGLFTLIPIGLLGGFAVSYFFSASTLLYLAMRRVVDGQDMSEIWMPTMVPGTQARRTPPPPPAPAAASGEAISETGPADET